MKFPSIKSLADSAASTLKRFPFEVLFALAGTIAAIIYINKEELLPASLYTKIIMTANLGLLISLATSLFIESKGGQKKWIIRFVVALIACSLLFIFNPQLRSIDWVRFFLLSLAFHLIVAFAAFTEKGHIKGFWQFNKTLFLRFLASMLYSIVLYLGIAAAISASKLLFNLHFEYKVYGILFAIVAGLFNTIFFLAGIPSNIAELDQDDTYPKGLKVFTQYVLIPLASLYVIILLAYEIKILVQWSLPKGLVSNLILGYAVFGILSILLIYPLRDQEENKWIKTYARSFYFLLLPLIVLLFLAVFTRILPYGITAPRYFLIVLAGWLLFITFYFLLSRKQNIKIIPISLCILTLLSVYGPQSAFSVSKYSQRRLLINIFKKYGAFNNGKLSSLSKTTVSKKDGQNAIEKLNYFVYDNDLSGLQPCLNKDIEKTIDSLQKVKGIRPVYSKTKSGYMDEYELKRHEMEWVTNYLGLKSFSDDDSYQSSVYSFDSENPDLVSTKGVDYVLSINNEYNNEDSSLKIDNISIKSTSDTSDVYTLTINNEKFLFNVRRLALGLLQTEDKLKKYIVTTGYGKTFKLPGKMITMTQQTQHFKVTLQVNNLKLNTYSTVAINSVRGTYLISVLK